MINHAYIAPRYGFNFGANVEVMTAAMLDAYLLHNPLASFDEVKLWFEKELEPHEPFTVWSPIVATYVRKRLERPKLPAHQRSH